MNVILGPVYLAILVILWSVAIGIAFLVFLCVVYGIEEYLIPTFKYYLRAIENMKEKS